MFDQDIVLDEIANREAAKKIAPAELYLHLLKLCLTRLLFVDPHQQRLANEEIPTIRPPIRRRAFHTKMFDAIARRSTLFGRLRHYVWSALFLRRGGEFAPFERREGRDWPKDGETMIGLARLDNIQRCIKEILANDVAGDLIETGVWRGGACIFMRAALEAYGDSSRSVWVADSFAGLPKPDAQVAPADDGDMHWTFSQLSVSAAQVKRNFARYGLLDERVRFLPGWFAETLPDAPIERLALLRLDGDMYKSTMDALTSLYSKLTPGGFCIVDDYGAIPACRQAVDEFRASIGEEGELTAIDWSGVFWKKLSPE